MSHLTEIVVDAIGSGVSDEVSNVLIWVVTALRDRRAEGGNGDDGNGGNGGDD